MSQPPPPQWGPPQQPPQWGPQGYPLPQAPRSNNLAAKALAAIVGLIALLAIFMLVQVQRDNEVRARERVRRAAEDTARNLQRQQEADRAFAAMTPEQHLRAALESLGDRSRGLVGAPEARRHLAEVPADAGVLARQAVRALDEIEQRVTLARARWEYRNSRDEMRGTSTQVACLPSTTRLQFDFPYQGGSTAHLCFRQNAQGLDAWLDVDRGQFLCRIRDCSVSMKFDSGPVVSFGGDRPSDGTSTMIFLDNAAQILASTRTAHRILVEAEFYRAGAQQITFDDAGGLVWPPAEGAR